MGLSDGLDILLVLVSSVVKLLAVTVTHISQGANLSLEDQKLLLELGDLVMQVTTLGAAIVALTNQNLVALSERVDLSSDAGDSLPSAAERLFQQVDLSMASCVSSSVVMQVFLELITLSNDQAVILTRSVEGFLDVNLAGLDLTKPLLDGDNLALEVLVLERSFSKTLVRFLPIQ